MSPAEAYALLAITLFVVAIAVASELREVRRIVGRIGDMPSARYLRVNEREKFWLTGLACGALITLGGLVL